MNGTQAEMSSYEIFHHLANLGEEQSCGREPIISGGKKIEMRTDASSLVMPILTYLSALGNGKFLES
jgi:hypothetical protein